MPTYIRVKDLANAATTPATDDFILLSGSANGARKISRADFLTAVAGFYTANPSTYKLATLDAGNKVLVSQLPSSAFSYQGTWAASSNTPSLANGTGTAGDTYYASDSGSVNFGAGSISFLAGDAVVYDGSVWEKVPDVVNLLDGKGTLDEAKTTLEVPDVGTAPNEVPLNGQLGSMAYQSADSVSVDTLEVTDKVEGSLGIDVTPAASKLEISGTTNSSMMLTRTSSGIVSNLEDAAGYGALALYQAGGGVKAYVTGNGNSYLNGGNVGINQSSPQSSLHVNSSTADNLRLERDATNDWRIQLTSGALAFRDATNDAERVRIDSGGNLILTKGGGAYLQLKDASAVRGSINVGTSDGLIFSTGASFTEKMRLDGDGLKFNGDTAAANAVNDFEVGTWTPVFAPSGGSFAALTMNVVAARYCKVGHQVSVNCYCQTTNLDTTGASGQVMITGLPYGNAGSNNFVAVHVGYAIDWTEAPSGGYVNQGSTQIVLNKRFTGITGSLSPMDVNGLNTASGTKNTIMLTATYNSF